MIAYILTCLILAGLLFLANVPTIRKLNKDLKVKFLKSYEDKQLLNNYEIEKLENPSFDWKDDAGFCQWLMEQTGDKKLGERIYNKYGNFEYKKDSQENKIFWRTVRIVIAFACVIPFFYEFPSWGSRLFGNEIHVIRTNSSNSQVKEVFLLPNTGIFQLPFDDTREHIIPVSNSDRAFKKEKTVSICQTINGDPRTFRIKFALKSDDYLKFLTQINNSGTYRSRFLQDETLVLNNFQSIVEKSHLPAKELAHSLGELFNKWLADRDITSAQVQILSVSEHSDREVQVY